MPRTHGVAAHSWIILAPALAVLNMTDLSAQKPPAEPEIRAARKASNDAMRRHDIQAFGFYLVDDFVQVRGNGTLVASKQASIDTLTRAFADPRAIRFERITDKVEISQAAPLAAEHGHWIGTHPDGTRAFGGTYLAMWRQTLAGWKIRSELFIVLECHDEAACAAYRQPPK